MAAVYLYLNAILYATFALWCTLAAQSTALNIGYAALTRGGRSEYLVVYGGLQAGLAIIFFILARESERQRLGIMLSVALYAPIVVYRLATLVQFSPVGRTTLATAALEGTLLSMALALLFAAHARGS